MAQYYWLRETRRSRSMQNDKWIRHRRCRMFFKWIRWSFVAIQHVFQAWGMANMHSATFQFSWEVIVFRGKESFAFSKLEEIDLPFKTIPW